ncbi:glycosyl hydrolase family 8 [Pseudobacteroides cellulosolvens]|uniref:Glycoside hydrolase family 8 n=1 Tax=Pseudobacteroides cellulosolvens ATCC 35603 = DSM 2933 TaxID=398512 RepID=A0A0L6JHI9_9FIRM|nr:glycosyl hydrolase family 8 [Pseudobacteroides cellulosolvens]KNY25189.1 glycoside hydrolase family 8 [Pseudobacteroides cellulosolvens ATCC 35603 = DSM 2933]
MRMKKSIIWVLVCSIIASYFVQSSITTRAATPDVPSVGVYESGVYRNLFKEMGKTDAEIQAKLDQAWSSLFEGDSNHTIYYPVGSDEAFIKDVNNNDCRSEGQSYGMMICVQMDKQTEFNKLWKFAKNHMYHSSGQYKGFFGWQCNVTSPYNLKDNTPASDGEEYFATALLFAARRWGNGTGIFNYEAEAQALLDAMLHQADDGQGYNMFNNNSNQVVFCPSAGNYDFTDPSYHLPGFYELWSLWGPERDRAKWKTIAATSRSFMQKTTHPTTGLGPDYANFDGSPKSVSWGGNHQDFMYDAHRIANNIAFDYAWWAKDSWAITHANRIQDFFMKQGLTTYTNTYTISGKPTGNEHQMALIAMNAVASLAATKSQAYDFVNELWKLNPPGGTKRYYDGCLLFFALLHCSGNFKIWGGPEAPQNTPTNTPTPTKYSPVPTILGDINNDGVINMADVLLLAIKFNSTAGDGKYLASYDLNNDNTINMADILVIAINFGAIVPVATATPTKAPTKAPATPTSTKIPYTSTPTPVPYTKVVALTFDDGPSSQTTLVLDKLKKYNAKATFMLIGSKISSADAVMKRIVSEGHECGNHSWSHQSMNGMGASSISQEISQTNSAINKYTGSDPKFFRAPNLAVGGSMASTIKLPFVVGVIAQDWNGGSATTAQARADKVTSGVRDGSIVLMHCTQPGFHPTPEALDIIIPKLQSQGYSFVTLSELFKAKGKTPQAGVSYDGAW